MLDPSTPRSLPASLSASSSSFLTPSLPASVSRSSHLLLLFPLRNTNLQLALPKSLVRSCISSTTDSPETILKVQQYLADTAPTYYVVDKELDCTLPTELCHQIVEVNVHSIPDKLPTSLLPSSLSISSSPLLFLTLLEPIVSSDTLMSLSSVPISRSCRPSKSLSVFSSLLPPKEQCD